MALFNFTIVFPGQNESVIPRIGHLYAPNNTLAEIATAGFLDLYVRRLSLSVLPTDFIAAVGSDGHQWYKPVISAGSITLTVLP